MALSGSVNTSSHEGRYYKLSWTAKQSIANNTSTISWTLEALGGSSSWYAERTLTVYIGGTKVYSKENRVERYTGTIKTGTITLTHNSAGAKSFDVSVNAAVYGTTVNCKGSGSFTLDTIARASTITISNGTLGTPQEIVIDAKDSSFEHVITYTCGSVSGVILGSATLPATGRRTWFTPPLELAKQNTTGTSVSVTVQIKTYTSSGSHIGTTSKIITCAMPASIKPSCSIKVTDTTGHKSTYGKAIKGLSKLKIETSALTMYNSPIASYKVTANGETFTVASATTDFLKYSGSLSITAQVTDKRGRKGTAEVIEEVYNYSPPAISKLNVKRCNGNGSENDQGAYVQVTISGNATPLGGANIARYTLKYKKSHESSYTTISSTILEQDGIVGDVTDGTYIFAADTESSYDVVVEIEDNFQTTSRNTSASTAFTLLDFHESGTGIGVGKVSEKENLFDVGIDARFEGDVCGNALGLGALPEIAENENFNDYTDSGCWCVPNNAQATAMYNAGLNIPSKNAGRLIVANGTGWDDPATEYKYRLQYYFPYLSTLPAFVRHIRKTDASGWIYGNWRNISCAVEIPFTPVDGVTVTRCTVAFNNDIVTMCFSGKCSSAITAGTTKQIGTIDEGGRPAKSIVTCGLQGDGIAACWVTNTGVVNIRPVATGYTANKVIEFNLSWNVEAAWQ